jgi:hypothetical protein
MLNLKPARCRWRLGRPLAGVLLGAAALALTGCTRVESPAPVMSAPSVPVREQTYEIGDWCGGACLGLENWPYQVKDGRLLFALILAYDYAPAWRELAQACAAGDATVRTGAMFSDHSVAHYDVVRNEIVVDPSLLAEPETVLAAILAHEVAHCAQRAAARVPDAASCFRRELFAVEWETHVYASLPPSSHWTAWVMGLELRHDRWQDGTLGDLVLTTWQDACLGEDWSDAA